MYVDNTKQFESVLSLCTGYGGIERGLELAGLEHRVIAHVEIEAYAAANLVAKMEQGRMVPAPIWTDLKTLPVDCFRDRVELITGGYPCQPFSAAGKRAGKDDPRHLWPWIREHIQAIRPFRCFFENVEGHISLGLREVIEDLEELGYETTWGIFSAAEVGAPHQRKRVYILGSDTNCRDGSAKQERQHKGSKELDGCCNGRLAASGSENMASRDWDANGIDDSQKQGISQGQDSQPSGVCANVANSDSEQQRRDSALDKNTQRQTISGTKPSWRGSDLADAISEGSQRRLHRRQDKKRQSELRYAGCGSSARQQQGQEIWDFEPGLGRVVDGCADRVDRLRLLGNGVVPQTAAQAWITLNRQLQGEE
jgi:DNA (cytosine-5)-methyltransferase 1